MSLVATLNVLNTKVAADQTDFIVYVDLADMPALFWSTVANGGGDIRCYKSDGTTELAREVVTCDTATDTGEMHIKYAGTLSSSVDTEIQIHADGTSSEPAVTATYGRNNVWTAYTMVSHMYDLTTSTVQDSTGSTTLTKATASNPNEITTTTPFRTSQSYQTQGDYIVPAAYFNHANITYQAWVRWNAWTSTASYPLAKRSSSSNGGVELKCSGATGDTHGITLRISSTWQGATGPNTDINLDTNYHVVGTYDGTSIYVYEDGVQGTVSSYSGTIPNLNIKTWIGGHVGYPSLYYTQGSIGEARVSPSALSASWIETEYNNQSSASTFYSLGGATASDNALAMCNF